MNQNMAIAYLESIGFEQRQRPGCNGSPWLARELRFSTGQVTLYVARSVCFYPCEWFVMIDDMMLPNARDTAELLKIVGWLLERQPEEGSGA